MFHNTKGQDSGKVSQNNFRKGEWCKKQLLVLLLGILGGCYAPSHIKSSPSNLYFILVSACDSPL